MEQLHAQVGFEAFHLMTDRRRGDEQLRGGGLEAEAARGRFEGPQCIERRWMAGLHGRYAGVEDRLILSGYFS
jgi:hypothetical protein